MLTSVFLGTAPPAGPPENLINQFSFFKGISDYVHTLALICYFFVPLKVVVCDVKNHNYLIKLLKFSTSGVTIILLAQCILGQ